MAQQIRIGDGRMVTAHDGVTIRRCEPGPCPPDNAFDAHQFEGWRMTCGDDLEFDLEHRVGGSDPLVSPARRN